MFCPDCAGRRFQKAEMLRRLRKHLREVLFTPRKDLEQPSLTYSIQRRVCKLMIQLMQSQTIICRGEVIPQDTLDLCEVEEFPVNKKETVH